MVIGVLQFELIIHDAESLKDKRRVIRSVKDKLHLHHMVSVAEVARQDSLSVAVLGLACVAATERRVGEILDSVVDRLRTLRDARVGDIDRQIFRGEEARRDLPAWSMPEDDQ